MGYYDKEDILAAEHAALKTLAKGHPDNAAYVCGLLRGITCIVDELIAEKEGED